MDGNGELLHRREPVSQAYCERDVDSATQVLGI